MSVELDACMSADESARFEREAIKRLFKDDDDDVRMSAAERKRAARRLDELAPLTPANVDVLAQQIGRGASVDTQQLIGRLERCGRAYPLQVIRALARMVVDDGEPIRGMAARSLERLCQMDAGAVQDALTSALMTRPDRVRQAVMGLLCAAANGIGSRDGSGQQSPGVPPQSVAMAAGRDSRRFRDIVAEAASRLRAGQARTMIDAFLIVVDEAEEDAGLSVPCAAIAVLGRLAHEVRGEAAAGLVARLVGRLAECAGNADWQVRRSVLLALGNVPALRDGAGLGIAIGLLGDPVGMVRQAALSLLLPTMLMHPRDVVAPWLSAMDTADADARQRAVVVLGDIEPSDARVVDRLICAVGDTDERVACTAIQTLGRIPTIDTCVAATAMMAALDHEVPEVRRCAAMGLGRIDPSRTGSSDVVVALMAATDDANTDVADAAMESLGLIGVQDPGQLAAGIVRALTARRAQGDVGAARTATYLAREMRLASTWQERAEVMKAWNQIETTTSTEILGELPPLFLAGQAGVYLQESDFQASHALALVRLLGGVRTRDPKPVVLCLLTLLNDANWTFRDAAVRALASYVGSDGRVPARLVRLLSEDPAAAVRIAAASVLGASGTADRYVIDALRGMQGQDTNPNANAAFGRAWMRIDATGASGAHIGPSETGREGTREETTWPASTGFEVSQAAHAAACNPPARVDDLDSLTVIAPSIPHIPEG